jgi:DNA-binding LacI/PurR family transcriptional regulator
MKDVAAAAGVTTSTVCRALGVDSRIPEATRLRIRKLATSLGYRPDPLLSAYARQCRGDSEGSEITTLAYITQFSTPDEWTRNWFYALLFKGANGQAQRNGYRLEHFWMRGPGMTESRLSNILHSRGIAGVCIAPAPEVRSRLNLEWSRFSCVTIGYSVQRPDLHRIAPHHFHTVLCASRKLWQLGYTRIGLCVYAHTSGRVDDLWLAGSLVAGRQHPETPIEVFLFDDNNRHEIASWIHSKQIDVVLSDNQVVLRELRRQGLRIPGEIDYATLNWISNEPEIAGVDQRPVSIGAAAVDLVVAQIRRGERGIPEMPVTSLVEGVWVNGPSLLRKSTGTSSLLTSALVKDS